MGRVRRGIRFLPDMMWIRRSTVDYMQYVGPVVYIFCRSLLALEMRGVFMFGFFDSKSYKGSNFERAILSRVDQLASASAEDGAWFAEALVREHPQFYKSFFGGQSVPELSLEDPNTRDLYVTFAARTAWIIGVLLGSSFVAARDYAQGLDELRSRDSVAALAVSSCLAQFIGASDLPIKQTSGGYYRYFSAYLILRQSFGMFGFLDPWRNFIKGITIPEGLAGLDLLRWFDDDFTQVLEGLAPRAEQQTRHQVMQQLHGFRSTVGFIPAPAASFSLNLILDLPPSVFTAVWTMPPVIAHGSHFGNYARGISGGGPGSAAMQTRSMLINAGVRLPT
jgi:hypothetical protein